MPLYAMCPIAAAQIVCSSASFGFNFMLLTICEMPVYLVVAWSWPARTCGPPKPLLKSPANMSIAMRRGLTPCGKLVTLCTSASPAAPASLVLASPFGVLFFDSAYSRHVTTGQEGMPTKNLEYSRNALFFCSSRCFACSFESTRTVKCLNSLGVYTGNLLCTTAAILPVCKSTGYGGFANGWRQGRCAQLPSRG